MASIDRRSAKDGVWYPDVGDAIAGVPGGEKDIFGAGAAEVSSTFGRSAVSEVAANFDDDGNSIAKSAGF